jgi:alpha-mannosidase
MACRSLFVSIALESACSSICFSLQLGFDSLFFARIDYQDRAKRLKEKNLEVVWQGSKSLGSTS